MRVSTWGNSPAIRLTATFKFDRLEASERR
jgi:antitoxin component of MazEF toxin-antitoxin module